MNPFNNNYPNLNASDRIRDKKSAHIYATAKKQFQTKRICKKKNIRYYKNGKVRSNRTSNRKLDEIKDLLVEIRDILKGRDPRSVIAEQRGMTRE